MKLPLLQLQDFFELLKFGTPIRVIKHSKEENKVLMNCTIGGFTIPYHLEGDERATNLIVIGYGVEGGTLIVHVK